MLTDDRLSDSSSLDSWSFLAVIFTCNKNMTYIQLTVSQNYTNIQAEDEK